MKRSVTVQIAGLRYSLRTDDDDRTVKALAAYTIPKIDVQIAATFRSAPGITNGGNAAPSGVQANFVASTALAAQSLGRPLSGSAPNVTVNIVKPGSMYGERLNQVDLRFAKILRFAERRVSLNVDLYNALNGNAVLQQSNTYGNWQQPQGILVGRSVKFSTQYSF